MTKFFLHLILKRTTMSKQYYFFTLLLALSLQLSPFTNLFAQVIWTGTTDSDWAIASNWDTNTVPTADDDVYLFSGANPPQIKAGTNAVAHSVRVEFSTVFTIEDGATLQVDGGNTINNSDDAFRVNGTLQNGGKIIIGKNKPTLGAGIIVQGTLNNQSTGEIEIDQVSKHGVWILSASSTNFTNSGKITIGANTAVALNGIYSIGNFTNEATGEIYIDNITDGEGINIDGGTLNNSNSINIGPNLKGSGIKVDGNATVDNFSSGKINIFGVGPGQDGISNGTSGTNQVNNEGVICINSANVDGANINPAIIQIGSGTLNASGCPFPTSPQVPTLSEWGLIILALLLMTLGVLYQLNPNYVEQLDKQ